MQSDRRQKSYLALAVAVSTCRGLASSSTSMPSSSRACVRIGSRFVNATATWQGDWVSDIFQLYPRLCIQVDLRLGSSRCVYNVDYESTFNHLGLGKGKACCFFFHQDFRKSRADSMTRNVSALSRILFSPFLAPQHMAKWQHGPRPANPPGLEPGFRAQCAAG